LLLRHSLLLHLRRVNMLLLLLLLRLLQLRLLLLQLRLLLLLVTMRQIHFRPDHIWPRNFAHGLRPECIPIRICGLQGSGRGSRTVALGHTLTLWHTLAMRCRTLYTLAARNARNLRRSASSDRGGLLLVLQDHRVNVKVGHIVVKPKVARHLCYPVDNCK
jgi:hypothetical protein